MLLTYVLIVQISEFVQNLTFWHSTVITFLEKKTYTKETFLHVFLSKQQTKIYVKDLRCSKRCESVVIVQSELWNGNTSRTVFDKRCQRKTFYLLWMFIMYIQHVGDIQMCIYCEHPFYAYAGKQLSQNTHNKKLIKVRMQCFSENFRKKKLIFDILIPFDKIFPGNI